MKKLYEKREVMLSENFDFSKYPSWVEDMYFDVDETVPEKIEFLEEFGFNVTKETLELVGVFEFESYDIKRAGRNHSYPNEWMLDNAKRFFPEVYSSVSSYDRELILIMPWEWFFREAELSGDLNTMTRTRDNLFLWIEF